MLRPNFFIPACVFAVAFSASRQTTTLADTMPDDCSAVYNVTQDQCYQSINEAVLASSDGDEILVGPGTYNESIRLDHNSLTLRSTNGPENTILCGLGTNQVVDIFGPTLEIVMEGFTITGGHAQKGGGIMALSVLNLQLTNCTFTGNHANIRGGGLYIKDGAVSANRCRFLGNSASATSESQGGGIYSWSSTATLVDCLFEHNSATDSGGGLQCSYSSATIHDSLFLENSLVTDQDCRGGGVSCTTGDLTFVNCRLVGNSAVSTSSSGQSSGGGLYSTYTEITATNCSFCGNSATVSCDTGERTAHGGGAFLTGSGTLTSCFFSGNTSSYRAGALELSGDYPINSCTFHNNYAAYSAGAIHRCVDGPIYLSNSIVWGNNAPDYQEIEAGEDSIVTYSCIQGGFPGRGNINANPLFVNPAGPDGLPGTIDDDPRLMPTASPCIDAGSNGLIPADEFDLDNDANTDEPLPFDYYRHPRVSDDPTRPDTGPGPAPLVDMGVYETQPATLADLDGDGDVDLYDFMIFQEQFTGSTI